MFGFFAYNIGTVLTGIVLLGVFAAIIVNIHRDKKKGGCSGCSCDCDKSCK